MKYWIISLKKKKNYDKFEIKSSEKKKENLTHLQEIEWNYEKLNDKSCTNEFHEKKCWNGKNIL